MIRWVHQLHMYTVEVHADVQCTVSVWHVQLQLHVHMYHEVCMMVPSSCRTFCGWPIKLLNLTQRVPKMPPEWGVGQDIPTKQRCFLENGNSSTLSLDFPVFFLAFYGLSTYSTTVQKFHIFTWIHCSHQIVDQGLSIDRLWIFKMRFESWSKNPGSKDRCIA